MKWVALAILVCIVPYTWITLKYRKEGPAYQPYQDNKDRAQVMRLLDAGFQRVAGSLQRAVDPLPSAAPPAHAATERVPGGMPPVLSELLIDPPLVPETVTQVLAPAVLAADQPWRIGVVATTPERHEVLASATLFRHDREFTLAIAYDPQDHTLEARRLATTAWIELPPGTLEPGTYRATLVGARNALRWTFTVR